MNRGNMKLQREDMSKAIILTCTILKLRFELIVLKMEVKTNIHKNSVEEILLKLLSRLPLNNGNDT